MKIAAFNRGVAAGIEAAISDLSQQDKVAVSSRTVGEHLIGNEPRRLLDLRGDGLFSPRARELSRFYKDYADRERMDPERAARTGTIAGAGLGGLFGGVSGAALGSIAGKAPSLKALAIPTAIGMGIGGLGLGLAGRSVGRNVAERENRWIDQSAERAGLPARALSRVHRTLDRLAYGANNLKKDPLTENPYAGFDNKIIV